MANRFHADEHRTLKTHFKVHKYNWDKCKGKIKEEIVEREKKTNENETKYV